MKVIRPFFFITATLLVVILSLAVYADSDVAEPFAALDLISPTGTLTDSPGNPIFEWAKSEGATSYQLYVHRAGSITPPVIYETNISASQYCGGATCILDPTTLANGDSYWLANGSYEVYVSAEGITWGGPFSFSINMGAPAAPQLDSVIETSTTTPTFQFSLPGNAAKAAWIHLYVAPQLSLPNVMLDTWVKRRDVCGGDAGTSCAFQMPTALTMGSAYSLYVQSWNAGGFSTGGMAGWAGPLNFNIGDGQPPAAPAQVQANFNAGVLTITWKDDPYSEWFNLWVGSESSTLYSGWYQKNSSGPSNLSATCTGTTCTVTIQGASSLVTGGTVYIQAWGSGGFSTGGVGGWSEPTSVQASAASLNWTEKEKVSVVRMEAQGAAVNGKLYVFGGYVYSLEVTTRGDVYDPATDTWTQIADMPEGITHAPVIVEGSRIWVLGGFVGDFPGYTTANVHIYDTVTNAWSSGPMLPEPLAGGGAAILGRNVHYFGGTFRQANTSNYSDRDSHYVLNLDNIAAGWSALAPLPTTRNHMAGIAANGKIYAIGGQLGGAEGTTNQSIMEMYNPATDTWSQVASMPTKRGHITSSIFEINGWIYVIGGTNDDGQGGAPSTDVARYNPITDMWQTITSLPGGRKSPVADRIGSTIYVATGNAGGSTPTIWQGVMSNP